jgi:hypothetical protein
MRPFVKLVLSAAIAVCSLQLLRAQDLAPRAYLITPQHSNAVTLTWSFYDGGLNFNGTIPITGATGTYSVPVFSYYHSFSFFGRSANITASLPYAVGTFSGSVLGAQRSLYRSGLLDFTFMKWKQKMLLGASLKIIAPTGQYDPTKLINWGINRWAFKPEFGYSQRWGNWVLDGYAGVWFYTTNNAFFDIPVPKPQTEAPVGSFEGHLSRDFKRNRLWVSLDGNFWVGGITSLNGIRKLESKQTSSRIGGTFSVPVSKHQSLKFSYSNGTYIRFGGNYQTVSVAWQYSWLGRPK